MEVSALIAAGSAVVAAISAAVAAFDYRRTARSQRLSILRDARSEFRGERIRAARQLLYSPGYAEKLADGSAPTHDEVPLLGDLLGFYEYLGVMVARKTLRAHDVESLFPNSPLDTWCLAQPYIQRQRTERGVPYADQFERMIDAFSRTTDCPPTQ